MGKMSKGGGGLGVPKGLEHFFRISTTLGFPKVLEYGKNCQMSTTFLEANNIKIYAVLSDFAKCRDSRVKSAPQLPKLEGGGVQPIRAMPIFRLFFFLNMASLRPKSLAWQVQPAPPQGDGPQQVIVSNQL